MTTTATNSEYQIAMTRPTPKVDFPIVIGIRQRLTDQQKVMIKDAYEAKRWGETPKSRPGIGSITVDSPAPNNLHLDKEMGCSRVVLSSLLGSNDRHSLSMFLQWERALDIKIINKKELTDSFKGYLQANGIS